MTINPTLILALGTAIVAGLVGSFALMKRMTLAGDVISHVALPGIGLALLFHINPIIGGGVTLLIGTLVIWKLEQHTGLSTETIIGVMFAGAVALGALLTPEEDIIDALFGGTPEVNLLGFLLGLLAIGTAIGFIVRFRHELIVSLFSPELAASAGVSVPRLNLYFLLIFSLTVLLGLQFLGALLMGALIIIPAAVGRQLTHTLEMFLLVSTLASATSVLAGYWVATTYGLQLGPTVITVASALFALSLLKKKI